MTNPAMDETMNEIYGAPIQDKKGDLLKDIANLEQDIRAAERETVVANEQPYNYNSATPEEANSARKAIVFLKRDLDKKKTEFKELGY